MKELVCQHCDKNYKVYGPFRERVSRYCSRRCLDASKAGPRAGIAVRRAKAFAARPTPPPSPYADACYIPLTKGMFALVDFDLYERLSTNLWSVTTGQRSGIYAASGRTLLHRHVAQAPKGKIVDHINGDSLDNRRCNLRVVSAQGNAWNNRGHSAKSGYKGVTHTPSGRWAARIMVNRKQINLGTYDGKEDAARAYNKAALNYFGEYARLNDV